MTDARANRASEDNRAIKVASTKATHVVTLLLADPRVNPKAEDSKAIKSAIQGSHDQVADDVDPAYQVAHNCVHQRANQGANQVEPAIQVAHN